MSELDKLIKSRMEFKILIIDDKPNMRKTIRNMLRVLGFNTFREAEDGEDAFEKMTIEKFDFILCDWNMPRMNGFELLQKVRNDDRFKQVPFLMVTAEVEVGTVAQAIEHDVDGYIIKPFVPKILESKMVEVLNKKLEPSEVDTQIQLAEAFTQAGRYNNAHEELDKVEKIAPRSPKIHFARGLVYESAGDDEKAESSFRKARQAGPLFIKAREKLAEIFKKQGKKDELLQVLKEAVDISPKSADRQTDLGKALLIAGKPQDAKKAFNQAVGIDPENASRKTEIGEAFLDKGMAAEAENAFKSAIESNPAEVYTYNRLGIAFRRQKKYTEAIDNYLQALDIAPEEEGLHFNLARAYLEAGNDGRAKTALRQAIKVAPDFKEAKELLEKIQKARQ